MAYAAIDDDLAVGRMSSMAKNFSACDDEAEILMKMTMTEGSCCDVDGDDEDGVNV